MGSKTVILKNAIDSWVNNGTTAQKARNYSTTTRLAIDSATAIPFLYFNRPFPLGANILDGKLRVWTTATWTGTPPTITAQLVAGQWNGTKVNWNNQPTVVATPVATATPATTAADALIELDVTALLATVSSGGNAWWGFRLTTSGTVNGRYLHSTQSLDFKPELEVTYAEAPSAPTTLSPSGGRAVSVTKPTLRFDFTDFAGGGGLAAVQVQINSTNVWTSPTFDSGTVATSDPSLDLTTTAYAGLSLGATVYWRVRVKDVAGLWSNWSDATTFTRAAKGAVTITNPAASPNDHVTEPTPPITHTFSGTQVRWRKRILDGVTGAELHSSGLRTGAELTYTLPAGVLHDGGSYVVEVAVGDNVDREATAGDPALVIATRPFTVSYDATVADFTNIRVHFVDNKAIILADRATAPDAIILERGPAGGQRVPILTDLDPADYLQTGTTTYRFEDYPPPRGAQTWLPRAVVNGKQSAPADGATDLLVTSGVWLTDVERGLSLFIAADGNGGWGMGEDSETFAGLGSTKPVRITQSVRGWEDTIDGFLVSTPEVSMLEWYEIALDLRSRPGRPLVMQVGTEAFTVTTSPLRVSPTGGTTPTKRGISFTFEMVSDPRYPVVL